MVPAARDLRRIQPKSFTRTLYPDNVYEVAWLPPRDKEMVVSYTVFWCKYKKERPHYCEGLLSWRDMAAPDSSIDVITHNISLPDSSNYQMAVTANTKDFSSGEPFSEHQLEQIQFLATAISWNNLFVCIV